jgi:phosphoglycolate phosphatase
MAAIIFDFDGTIADSFDYVAGFLANEAGLPPLSEEQKNQLRGRSMLAMARQLGYSWWRLPGLFIKGRRRMGQLMQHVKPFNGMLEVINKLHAEGHELFIVSSNTVKNVRRFLHSHQLHKYFLEVYGGAGLFGKAPTLRRLLKDQGLEREDGVFIGDELRDVQAAQSIGLRIIAVTWGFARPSDLEALQPTALANEPADLLRILEEL